VNWNFGASYLQSAFHEKVPAGGGGSGEVRRESLLVGGLYRAAIGGKQYDARTSYTATYRLKTSSSGE
jgi:hypothetical protein